MGTYLSVPFASRKVVHLEPSKQEHVKEARKMSADTNPQIQHMPLTPIHEEKMILDEIEVLEMPKEEPKAEPKAEQKEEPKEEPKAETKEEPKEEAKEEPKAEAKEEPPMAAATKLTIHIPEEPEVPIKAEPPRRSNRRHRKN